MRHVICLLVAITLLLSSLPVSAQSSSPEKKPPEPDANPEAKQQNAQIGADAKPCERIVIKLRMGEKIEGCFQKQECDDGYKNCGAVITQKGVARRIPYQDIKAINYRERFWKKAGKLGLMIVYSPLLLICSIKDCDL